MVAPGEIGFEGWADYVRTVNSAPAHRLIAYNWYRRFGEENGRPTDAAPGQSDVIPDDDKGPRAVSEGCWAAEYGGIGTDSNFGSWRRRGGRYARCGKEVSDDVRTRALGVPTTWRGRHVSNRAHTKSE